MTTNTHKINAVKLLNWLHAKGHSLYDSKTLVAQTTQFERFEKELDRMLTI